MTTRPEPVYLVFANRVVRAIDTKPGEPEHRANGRYFYEDGKVVRNASAAAAFATLEQAATYYHNQLTQCWRNIKTYSLQVAAIEAEMAREAKGNEQGEQIDSPSCGGRKK